MNKIFAALTEPIESDNTPTSGSPTSPPGKYDELIQRLFQRPSAVAIVGIGQDNGIVGGIAKELAASGKRVVIVPVDSLLRNETPLISTIEPNIWRWPSPLGRPHDFLGSSDSKQADANHWLDVLRRDFDSVLLDCPPLDWMFGVTEIAVMADAVVLVAQSGQTSKQQMQDNQCALRLRGATIAGCILVTG